MHPIVRNVLAVVAGVVVGGLVNSALVQVGPSIVPPPAGTDATTVEGLREGMKRFEPVHYLFPFLAHALGTLAGAAVAARLAARNPMRFALGIGVFFLIGGVTAVCMFDAPAWFNVTDLVLAYLPMAYLGGRLAAPRPATA